MHQLLFWTPKHGKRSVGGPALTYVDVLCKDTGLSVAELRSLIADTQQDFARIRYLENEVIVFYAVFCIMTVYFTALQHTSVRIPIYLRGMSREDYVLFRF